MIHCILCGKYRVIHKSMKHFKNSQQITQRLMVVLTPIERETFQAFFSLHISQMLNMPTFVNTTDIYAMVHLVPHACQNITVDQSHSSGDTVAKILVISGDWRHKDSVHRKPPRRKRRTGLNPVTGVATALTRRLLFLCVLSTFVASFV